MAEQLVEIIPGIGRAVRPWPPFQAAKDFLTADGPSADGFAQLSDGPWAAIAYFAVVAAALLGISIAVARRRDT